MRVKIRPEVAAMEFKANVEKCCVTVFENMPEWHFSKEHFARLFDIVPEPWKVGDKAIDSDGDECVIVAIVRNVAGVDYGETSRMGPMFWNLSDITRPTTEQP